MNAPERRRRIDEICDAALDRNAAERPAFVVAACGSDTALRRDVEALLAHAETAERFLDVPAGRFLTTERANDGVSMIGRRVAHYSIVEKIGAGGMGVVYRAEDTRLHRPVALKFLPPDLTRDEEAKHRFVLEARSASALEHPNICTIYDIGESTDGQSFMAMAYYSGETLKTKITRGPLTLSAAADYAAQVAEGLVKAHNAGIVHRDIKPANVFITDDGIVKLLDFGIAKLLGHAGVTRTGTTLGTLAYMSPEQTTGSPADVRSDVWSLGVVLYEMIAGRLPFNGELPQAVALAIAQTTPDPLTALRPGVPPELERIVNRALAKTPADRFQTVADLLAALRHVRREPGHPPATGAFAPWRSRTLAYAVIAAVVAAGVAAGWVSHSSSRQRWALETAVPQIERLIDAGEFTRAAAVTRDARSVLPGDPTLERLWIRSTGLASVESVPVGANVSIKRYGQDDNSWEVLGKTPLTNIRIARGISLWRIAKAGFAPVFFLDGPTVAPQPGLRNDVGGRFTLRPASAVPAGMVIGANGDIRLGYPATQASRVHVDGYLIDRYEVTNQEYKKFVDAGGYQKREFWKQPFVKEGRTIPWEEALALFRDATGRPGPAIWEAGSYPNGLENHPVAGVSWYEAAAYAEYAGKSLPTVYHWMAAGQLEMGSLIVHGSNFRSGRTQPVGDHMATSGSGTTDMAGNVKEWCWNESGNGKRFILGGGFGEPTYMFNFVDSQNPWDRRPNFGFRCVKFDSPPSAVASAAVDANYHDFSKDTPASDLLFNAYRGLYAYDHREMNVRVEATGTTENWTHEKVTFDAAYGTERVVAHLYLPKHASPPFQVIAYFPGASAVLDDNLDLDVLEDSLDFLMKSGRAVIAPVYKGMYERRDDLKPGGKPPGVFRDHVVMWSKDLGRSLDYLQTRPDIDRTRMAYLGFSLGGSRAPVLLAVEPRFKAAILSSGGFESRRDLPEVDGVNFAPRVKVPTLMLNGRYDDNFPVEASQTPLFQLLGTSAKDKKHVIYEGGHGDLPHREEVRETLDWLDKYLGPVRH